MIAAHLNPRQEAVWVPANHKALDLVHRPQALAVTRTIYNESIRAFYDATALTIEVGHNDEILRDRGFDLLPGKHDPPGMHTGILDPAVLRSFSKVRLVIKEAHDKHCGATCLIGLTGRIERLAYRLADAAEADPKRRAFELVVEMDEAERYDHAPRTDPYRRVLNAAAQSQFINAVRREFLADCEADGIEPTSSAARSAIAFLTRVTSHRLEVWNGHLAALNDVRPATEVDADDHDAARRRLNNFSGDIFRVALPHLKRLHDDGVCSVTAGRLPQYVSVDKVHVLDEGRLKGPEAFGKLAKRLRPVFRCSCTGMYGTHSAGIGKCSFARNGARFPADEVVEAARRMAIDRLKSESNDKEWPDVEEYDKEFRELV